MRLPSRVSAISTQRALSWSVEISAQVYMHYELRVYHHSHTDKSTCYLVTQKLQEKALRVIFSTKDLNQVRQYLCAQWEKIHIGAGLKVPLKDFIFAKAVKLSSYHNSAMMPPGAIVVRKHMASDPMAEVPYGWRVPYVGITVYTISFAVKIFNGFFVISMSSRVGLPEGNSSSLFTANDFASFRLVINNY